jgi:hypothetical protein
MNTFVTVGWVRGVSSWQPITRLSKGGLPALENVALWVGDGQIVAMVTDRFRMIYSSIPGFWESSPAEKPYLVPMDVFTRFVTASKGSGDKDKVTLRLEDDVVEFVDERTGTTISSACVVGQYPDIRGWVAKWTAATTVSSNATWNMKLLADVVKFADPATGVVTAAKRDVAWNVTAGDADAHSGAYRFDQGSPDTFAMYVMPVNRAVK